MDAFLAIVLGCIALALLAFVLLGIFTTPGTGAEQLGWGTGQRHDDAEAARDAEDLAQLLEATNARRRARGEPELTVEGVAQAGRADERVRRGLM